jgi:predicted ATPase/tetratricopeptide (TPR) repeat protein
MASGNRAVAKYGQDNPMLLPGVPFVGRDIELDRLDSFLAQAVEGQGQVCFIGGEAGTGKTALAAEFARRAQARYPDLLVTLGTGNAHTGIGDPYLPFRETLEMLTGNPSEGQTRALGSPGSAVARKMLARSVQILLDVAPELVGLFVPGAKIAGALGKAAANQMGWMDRLDELAVDNRKPAPEQQRIFEQYTAFIRELSQKAPILLFLDDLHWADVSSISLLFHLGRHTRSSRIMIVGMYRPEDIHLERDGKRHPLAQVLNECMRYYGDIIIDLAETQAVRGEAFVNNLLDAEPNVLDASFRSELFRLTGGHPLFTVELLRMLRVRGDLFQDVQGRWEARLGLDWTRLPARVEGVIEERIDRLSQELRMILSVASVQGRQFDAEVVAEVESLSPRLLVRQLGGELARQHRLVEALGVRRLGPRMLSQYRFLHSLFQHYLYSELDEVERARFHEEIGQALEHLYADLSIPEIAGELAHHFQSAAIVAKAVPYRLLAAHRAAEIGAYQESIAHLTDALDLLASLDGVRDPALYLRGTDAPRVQGVPMVEGTPTRDGYEMVLQTALGTALTATEGWASPGARRAYLRAYKLGQALGRPPEISPTLYGLAVLHELRGEYREAQVLMQEHLQLTEVQQNPRKAIASHELLSCSTFHQGLFIDSVEHADRGLALYVTEPPDRELSAIDDFRAACHGWSAMSLWFLGYSDQAVARVNDAITLAQTLNQPYNLSRALTHAASIHHMRREIAPALERAKAALATGSEHHLAYFVACAKILRGWGLAAQGRKAGIYEIQAGLEEHRKSGAEMDYPYFLGLLAEAYLLHDCPEEALETVLEALKLVEHGRAFFYEAELRRLRGLLLIAPGPRQDLEAGEASLREALAVARRQKARALELRAATTLARVSLGRGDRTILEELREILAEFGEGLDTRDLAEARELLQGAAPAVDVSTEGLSAMSTSGAASMTGA